MFVVDSGTPQAAWIFNGYDIPAFAEGIFDEYLGRVSGSVSKSENATGASN
jgi:hypothetical protein